MPADGMHAALACWDTAVPLGSSKSKDRRCFGYLQLASNCPLLAHLMTFMSAIWVAMGGKADVALCGESIVLDPLRTVPHRNLLLGNGVATVAQYEAMYLSIVKKDG